MLDALKIILPAVLPFILGMGKLYYDLVKLKTSNARLAKENKEQEMKLDIFDKVMDLSSINNIKMCIDQIFMHTRSTRFLILIAINGKDDFNKVSVIFEQHKNPELAVNATARYKNIFVDTAYKEMLKNAERAKSKVVHLDVANMESCLLKDFYQTEGVKHSKIRHLVRKSINADNDVLIFSSIATHDAKAFTRAELAFIKVSIEGTIIENLNRVLSA